MNWFALVFSLLITVTILFIGSIFAYKELYDNYCKAAEQLRAADAARSANVCIACQREHNKNHIGLH